MADLRAIHHCRDLEDTRRLGRWIAGRLDPGSIVLLKGDLGAGKTTLVRAICSALEVPEEQVTSPSFTLINEYRGRVPVTHIDLYRIEAGASLDSLFLDEYVDMKSSVVLVEWPEVAGAALAENAHIVEIQFGKSPDERVVTVQFARPEPAA